MVASVSIVALHLWRMEAQRLGLRMFDVDQEISSETIPLDLFVQRAEEFAASSGCSQIGWLLGERHDLRLLGDVGRAILSCSHLRPALQRLVDYFGLMQDATELSIRTEERYCYISYRILDPQIWPRHQDAIFTMAIIAQLIRKAALEYWNQVELFVESDDSSACQELVRLTGMTCYPDGDANILRFPAHFLDLPLEREPGIIPPDFRKLNQHVAQRMRQLDVRDRVRALIYQQLGSRQIDQEQIARALGMSGRTLRRRLAEENLSFQQIVDDCRMRQAAHEFLTRRQVSIAQTALRLGYSEHSTFTRAFARWSGMPPQAFIKNSMDPTWGSRGVH